VATELGDFVAGLDSVAEIQVILARLILVGAGVVEFVAELISVAVELVFARVSGRGTGIRILDTKLCTVAEDAVVRAGGSGGGAGIRILVAELLSVAEEAVVRTRVSRTYAIPCLFVTGLGAVAEEAVVDAGISRMNSAYAIQTTVLAIAHYAVFAGSTVVCGPVCG